MRLTQRLKQRLTQRLSHALKMRSRALRERLWPRPRIRGEVTLGLRQEGQPRIYVLPTRGGLAYSVALVLMLIASINYNLSLGYGLTFLLAALGVVCIIETHRNLAGIQVKCPHTLPGFAGGEIGFGLVLNATGERRMIHLQLEDTLGSYTHVSTDTQCALMLPALQRGRMAMPRLHISTRWPLGLVRVWSVLQFDQHTLIYPAPARTAPAPALASGQQRMQSGDDYHDLRAYQQSDPPQHVAWKVSARLEDGLLTKLFQHPVAAHLHLDLATTAGSDIEARLSTLTRQILDAEQQGQRYSLQVGTRAIAPGHGLPHRDQCLEALALHV